jgi:tRNA uridine 5-carbamoylmethylation protein Kti12
MIDLRKRFEPPNDSNRWDYPLFKVKVFSEVQKVSPLDADTSSTQVQTSVEAAPKKSSWKPKKKAEQPEAKPLADSSDNTKEIQPVEGMKGLSISGTAISTSDNLSDFEEFSISFDKIYQHLTNSAAIPTPNISTVVSKHAEADLLYELDRITSRIIQMIISHQNENLQEGMPLKFLDYDRAITFHKQINLAELQRYKTQYVKMNASHPPDSSKAIGSSFIDFLVSQF